MSLNINKPKYVNLFVFFSPINFRQYSVYVFVIFVETPQSILNRFIKALAASVCCYDGNGSTVHL